MTGLPSIPKKLTEGMCLILIVLVISLVPLKSAYGLRTQEQSAIYAVVWSPDESRLATGHDDGSVKIWDATTGEPVAILRGANERIGTLAWKSDGTQIAGGGSTTAWVWNVETGELLATLPDISPTAVTLVAWSIDNESIITWGLDTARYVWNAESYRLVSSDFRGGTAVQVLWNFDHSRVAIAAAIAIVIADPVTFDEMDAWTVPEAEADGGSAVTALTWSNAGNLIAGGDFAGSIRIWDTASGEILLTLRATDSAVPNREKTPVLALTFNEDDTRLLSVTVERTLHIHNTASGQIVETIALLPGILINDAVFNASGTWLACGGENGNLYIKNISDTSP